MRRLRDKEELVAEIGADGAIMVENHYVGRLDGFRFTPDASERRHPRHAPPAMRRLRVLADELAASRRRACRRRRTKPSR